jgi:hypothetical protein
MVVTFDINVVLDVFLTRVPHWPDSQQAVNLVVCGTITGVFPSHGISTFYYLLKRARSHQDALRDVDAVLANFKIGAMDRNGWLAARLLPFSDLEDAGVAQTAVESGSSWIVSRNLPDFKNSPVPAITPTEFLSRFFPGE